MAAIVTDRPTEGSMRVLSLTPDQAGSPAVKSLSNTQLPEAGSSRRPMFDPYQIHIPDGQGSAHKQEELLEKSDILLKLFDE